MLRARAREDPFLIYVDFVLYLIKQMKGICLSKVKATMLELTKSQTKNVVQSRPRCSVVIRTGVIRLGSDRVGVQVGVEFILPLARLRAVDDMQIRTEGERRGQRAEGREFRLQVPSQHDACGHNIKSEDFVRPDDALART